MNVFIVPKIQENITISHLKDTIRGELNQNSGDIKIIKVYSVLSDSLSKEEIFDYSTKGLVDGIVENIYFENLSNFLSYKSYVLVSKLPGVTDDEGVSAEKVFTDISFDGEKSCFIRVFSHELYIFENIIDAEYLKRFGEAYLGNPLINHFECGLFDGKVYYVPEVIIKSDSKIEEINLEVSDSELINISKQRLLSLDLDEMKTIKDYYLNQDTSKIRKHMYLSKQPTDIELEIIAQTWSEHCKHKEFGGIIEFHNKDTGEKIVIDSLFKTYIRGSTEIIRGRLEKAGNNWLIKIFSDNAGIVQIDDKRSFVWKVETHNSPSALDPYGGAITGILGVNRDAMGTGIGGAKMLFNTNVLCFAEPSYSKKLLKGQLHPSRIISGVIKGIEDGGNKSGIPTVNGAIVFDDRFAGKPLVYCGTGGILQRYYNGIDTSEKKIDAGDRIVMAGGRVGKDGIHGATFSSCEIDEFSPQSAVQIGSPITQKMLCDFLEIACVRGLVKCSTDNGAGGLSSSIGELATITNGAYVELKDVPLKYSGLKPWEIFVSESQERMTIVVEKSKMKAFMDLALEMEVESVDIGHFTSSGYLHVCYDSNTVAYLCLEFLHNAVPRKYLFAEWENPKKAFISEVMSPIHDYNEILLKMMAKPNIASKESVIRRFDHEVKGKSIIKPLMGKKGIAPQDAAVMRFDQESFAGLAVSNGICPKYGDIDPYEMSSGAFDEGIRQIIAVGGKLPDIDDKTNRFWSVNDNFCVPNCVYDPNSNPDGKLKLGKLVRMCQALYDMSIFFNIPMTSGKDSMKNDFVSEGVKISAPPTILYSMTAKIDDIRNTITSEFKKAGDIIYIFGETYDELGASEYFELSKRYGSNVPKVRKEYAKDLYLKVMKVSELLASCHDISDGGLACALSECAFGGSLGADINTTSSLSDEVFLFAESHSRFVVSVSPEKSALLEKEMGCMATKLGVVTDTYKLKISIDSRNLVNLDVEKLENSWRHGFEI